MTMRDFMGYGGAIILGLFSLTSLMLWWGKFGKDRTGAASSVGRWAVDLLLPLACIVVAVLILSGHLPWLRHHMQPLVLPAMGIQLWGSTQWTSNKKA